MLLCLTLLFSEKSYSHEIQFYDDQGNFVGYIDPLNQDTIFSPFGDPLAYVDNIAVFNFKGEFLGWYTNGILWDKNGNMLAFVEASAPPTVNVKVVEDFEKTKKAIPKRPMYYSRVPTQPKFTYQMSPDNTFSSVYKYPVE